MDSQNDCLEKVTPLNNGHFWVSMLDFWGENDIWKFSRMHKHHYFWEEKNCIEIQKQIWSERKIIQFLVCVALIPLLEFFRYLFPDLQK